MYKKDTNSKSFDVLKEMQQEILDIKIIGTLVNMGFGCTHSAFMKPQ